MTPTPDRRVSDRRSESRLSLYLGATLYHEGSPTAARIRNLSHAGALVEVPVAPEVGTLVQLVRGSLIVHALVSWVGEGRCGLKFSGSVDVRQWRLGPKNNEQQRVDEVVRLVKAGAVPLPVGLHEEMAGPVVQCDKTAAEDLGRVLELLGRLGEALADDIDVCTRHGAALQKLDISAQLIAAVKSSVESNFDPNATEVKLVGLRRSADQALQAKVYSRALG